MDICWSWNLPCLTDYCSLIARHNGQNWPLSKRIIGQIVAGRLIEASPYILIAPLFHGGESIEIVFPRSQRNNILFLCAHHQMIVSSENAVSKVQWERCLEYSLKVRLSPEWNSVGKILVHGNKFLAQNCHHFFVNLAINICDRVVATLNDSGMIRIRWPNLKDLFLDSGSNQSAMEILIRRMQKGDVRLRQPWSCFVLPSLKPAFVVSVTLKPTGTFDTFEKLMTYWRDLHRYNIDNVLAAKAFICNVQFHRGCPLYSYPNFCICPDTGSYERRHSTAHIVDLLYNDVDRILRNIGHEPLQISSGMWPALQWTASSSDVPEFKTPSREQLQSITVIRPNDRDSSHTYNVITEPSVSNTTDVIGEASSKCPFANSTETSTNDRESINEERELVITSVPETPAEFFESPNETDDKPESSVTNAGIGIRAHGKCTNFASGSISSQPPFDEGSTSTKQVIRFIPQQSKVKFASLGDHTKFQKPQGVPLKAKRVEP